MRSEIYSVFLIASLVSVVLPVFGQETVKEIIDILEKRDKLLFDQPEFSLSFRMVENEVFLPGSIVSGTIDLEIKANKVGSDWALSREFFNIDSPASDKAHYVILKKKELFSWRSESTGATVTKNNNDVTSAQMLDYLGFAGFTPSKAIAKDSGATWNEWKVKTMKYFFGEAAYCIAE